MNPDPISDIALRATPERIALDEGPALVLINPNSRMGAEALPATREALANRGIPVLESHAVTDHEHMDRLILQSLEGGVRRFILGGGDGTLNHAIKHLLGRDVSLGVLPLGTGNDLSLIHI